MMNIDTISQITDADQLTEMLADEELNLRVAQAGVDEMKMEAQEFEIAYHEYPGFEAAREDVIWYESRVIVIKKRLAQLQGEH